MNGLKTVGEAYGGLRYFYASGYCQLQVADDGDDFCHVYDNPDNLAKDVARLLGGDNAIGWYGNDPDAWLNPETTSGIRFVSGQALPGFLAELEKGKIDAGSLWDNEAAFTGAFGRRSPG